MAYRKTNTKGETAPNGYHYMSDDSLMSDEEHERVYGKPFAYSKNTSKMGLDCTFFGGASISSGAYIVENPLIGSNPTFPTMLDGVQIATGSDVAALISANLPAGSNFSSSTAKYGDYVYHNTHYPGSQNYYWGITKMEINVNTNSLSFVEFYQASPLSYSLSGMGLCSKDQDTLILVSHEVTELNLQTNGTVVANVLFQLPYSFQCTGDVVYRPADDTLIMLVNGSGSWEVSHYDYSGNLIDSFDLTYLNNYVSVTMFCYGGDIYFPIGGFMYRVDLYPLSITQVVMPPTNNLYAFTNGDGATSPECCDGSPPPLDPISKGWDCEITAYQSQAPYAPIYGCVEKFFPQAGQYSTQQDCIDSHCGGPQPVTIQCSQCNNGFAVSSVFQGTTCPPLWQPASLGDPCKPPTGPVPTDPIIYT